MIKIKELLIIATSLVWLTAPCLVLSQDTVRVMHYNLLNFGVTSGQCDNPVGNKVTQLGVIIPKIMPDIFTVNELGVNELHAENILQSVLKPINYDYKRAESSNVSGSNLANMLFYDSHKLSLHKQHAIDHYLRDINIYWLYYNSPDLATEQDTAFIIVCVLHLKAGSGSSDLDTRDHQANSLMDYLAGLGANDNYLLCGDFNVRSSTEASYQTFVNHSNTAIRFYDPINQPGSWNNNSAFAPIFTQSTRTTSESDCGSSGGMDDRYDFILASDNIINQADKVGYINGTYKAFGQDGMRFNSSINNPTNLVVSNLVANALYSMSDHLPIVADFEINSSRVVGVENPFIFDDLEVYVSLQNQLNIHNNGKENQQFSLSLIGLDGKTVLRKDISISANTKFSLGLGEISTGLYIVNIQGSKGTFFNKKVMLN